LHTLGPGISGLNALGWPKPSILYRNEEGPLIQLGWAAHCAWTLKLQAASFKLDSWSRI